MSCERSGVMRLSGCRGESDELVLSVLFTSWCRRKCPVELKIQGNSACTTTVTHVDQSDALLTLIITINTVVVIQQATISKITDLLL